MNRDNLRPIFAEKSEIYLNPSNNFPPRSQTPKMPETPERSPALKPSYSFPSDNDAPSPTTQKFGRFDLNIKIRNSSSKFGKGSLADLDDNDDQQKDTAGATSGPYSYYTKLIIENDRFPKGDPFANEYKQVASAILKLLAIRDKYTLPQSQYSMLSDIITLQPPSSEPIIKHSMDDRRPPKLEHAELKTVDGVYMPFIKEKPICEVLSVKDHLMDMAFLLNEAYNRSVKTFCYKRLCLLTEKYKIHLLYNREKEFYEQKMNIHRDFYNLRKVDNRIEHAAATDVKTFLDFVKKKTLTERDTKVFVDKESQEVLTLDQVIERFNLKSRVITAEDLEIRAFFWENMPRFDRAPKFRKPSRKDVVGEIFLKRDNLIKGRFLAELTHELFKDYQKYKFQLAEFRITYHGKDPEEWNKLAEWIDTFKLYDHRVRWLIQIPRIYDIHRKFKALNSFQDMLDNIFKPLFEVTINPEVNKALHKFLLTVAGFDTVDDDSVFSQSSSPSVFRVQPSQWTSEENPHFCYYSYYIWANLYTLNTLRKQRGLNTFSFRPQIGESGGSEHLMSAYLLADGIGRGALLKKTPLLEYLFYLKQIGISMSPLSDNKMLLKYKDNPFPSFFARGLNVSLSTDHPLLYHMTGQSLIEEYSVASQVFDLSSTDLCELARNSILQSGFEDILKSYWLGENYKSLDTDGNNDNKTNVPQARYFYRVETLRNEIADLRLMNEVLDGESQKDLDH